MRTMRHLKIEQRDQRKMLRRHAKQVRLFEAVEDSMDRLRSIDARSDGAYHLRAAQRHLDSAKRYYVHG